MITTKKRPDGLIEVFENGKRISTTSSESFAKQLSGGFLPSLNDVQANTQPDLPSGDPNVDRFTNLNFALNKAVDLGRQKRQDKTLDFLGGVIPKGALPATSFASVIEAFNRGSAPVESTFAKSALEAVQEKKKGNTFDLRSVGETLYQIEQDSSGRVVNTTPVLGSVSNGSGLFDIETGEELSPFDAAKSIVEKNLDASEDELVNAIRENVVDEDGESLITIGDAQRIAREGIAKRSPLTQEEIKNKIVAVLEPQKDQFSRSEAKTQAENQLKKSLGLSEDQSLPKSHKEAIEDALVEVYGATFFQNIFPGGRGTFPGSGGRF